jgi:hypothetical protein
VQLGGCSGCELTSTRSTATPTTDLDAVTVIND